MNSNSDYIGISEDRLHHILGVARECYQIAKNIGKDEYFCRYMFTIGWNHDIGYEFSKVQSEHPIISYDMVNSLHDELAQKLDLIPTSSIAILQHGYYDSEKFLEWKILNIADLTIDSKGNKVDVMQRLEDIKNRYGELSNQYLTACDIAVQVGLIDKNSVERNVNGG